MAKIIGTSKVILAGINDYRIDIARKHGGYAVVNSKNDAITDIVKKLPKF